MKRWMPVEEDHWGHFNVERKGRVVSVFYLGDAERDKGYVIAPLPEGIAVCRQVDAEGDAAPLDMPDTHEAIIKQALHWMRDDGGHILLAYGREFHDDVMARIDQVLQWLDSVSAHPAAPHYSHRNGETEPPTENGEFWLRGEVSYGFDEGLPVYKVAGRAIVIGDNEHGPYVLCDGWWNEVKETRGLTIDIKNTKGQWWGPITPPWEAQPAAQE